MRRFYKLVNRVTVPISLDEALDLTGEQMGHHIALSRLADCKVSTIFLCINHNFERTDAPILFETMIFGGKYDKSCHRYPGWKNYSIQLPRWMNHAIAVTIPGWYLAWFGHWLTVFKLMYEHARGEN